MTSSARGKEGAADRGRNAAAYAVSEIPRLRAAPIMPASAIIISTLTKPPSAKAIAPPATAAAAAKKGAGVDDARTLACLRARKSRQRQPGCQGIRQGQTGAHHEKPGRQEDHPPPPVAMPMTALWIAISTMPPVMALRGPLRRIGFQSCNRSY